MRRFLALLLLLPGLAFGQMTGGVMESQARAASNITGVVAPANGGTGVANNAAATFTRSGNHALTITTTGTTNVTLPTSGVLATNYLEGTFTPTVAFGGASVGVTYGAQAGFYTRIGNRVLFNLYVSLTSKGSSTGTATLAGLPVAASATGNSFVAVSLRCTAFGATVTTQMLMGEIAPSGTSITLNYLTAGNATAITDAMFGATTGCEASGQYPV